MKRFQLLVFVVLAAAMLAACGGGPPTAQELLAGAADSIAQAESLQFTLEREGDPIPLEAMMNAAVLSAEGAYQAPDSVHATVKVSAQGMIAEADVLWLPDGILFKLPPLIPEYMPIELEGAFDAAAIFDAEMGIPKILTSFQTPRLVGEEDLDGVATYHVSAQADGSDLSNLVGGAVQPGPAAVDVWVDKKTGDVVRIAISEESGGKWLLDFFAFGEPVEIPVP
jgi:hypothetical protein